ncbi:MAG TPA: class II aldolase/adducin family protein [Bacillota bacterium]
MNFDLLHPADQIVMIMERIYGYGMTTTSGGNLSILDDNGDIWITPGGIDKGSLTRNDIIRVKPDGTIVGNHKPSVELPFHQQIYQRRLNIKAVLHAHPPALVSFSIARKKPNTALIPHADLICGQVGMAEYGLPGSEELGENIAAVFSKGYDTVMLENHGVVVGHENLFKAFMAFETLDFCARLEIEANRLGKPIALSPQNIALSHQKQHTRIPEFVSHHYSSEEKQARRDMCQLIHRAYDQQVFTSTQGTFSQRLTDHSFIITPYMVDRKYIEPGEIVRIENNMREANKTPSRSVMLHQYIYEKHPHIHSIIIAHPPNIMAFAITDVLFDSRIIPESYILLRNVPKLPFGSSFMEPQKTAEVFTKNTPLALVANDCVIVTGSSLINAFDRLEVAEYSAKAIIASRSIGNVVMIDNERIAEIEKAFPL